MSEKLTPRQQHILDFMRVRDAENLEPMSGHEMARALWDTGVFTAKEQGQRSCFQLEAKNLIAEAGMTKTGAVRWVTNRRKPKYLACSLQRAAADYASRAMEYRNRGRLRAAVNWQTHASLAAGNARSIVGMLERGQ